MPSVRAVVQSAISYWGDLPGGRVMAVRASRCAEIVGQDLDVQALVAGPGDKPSLLLKGLREAGLSRASVTAYYSAFRRALTLAGYPTPAWPKAPPKPRKTREPMSRSDSENLITWLRAKGWGSTADLVVLLRGTGLRVRVEGLRGDHLRTELRDDGYDVLHVTGKGENERLIPVVDRETRDLLRSPERMAAIRSLSYEGHLDRWRKGLLAEGITSLLATPHSIRHMYATEALSRSGGNLALVQELLGHSDPGTTARYLENKLGEKAKALASSA